MPTRITDVPLQLTGPAALRRWSLRCHAAGMSVGLVPTMGALHAGHLSLVERALDQCDRVVVSIFVNPAQFGPSEDFDRYPRPRERDLALLASAGAHAVFLPAPDDLFPPGFATAVRVGDALSDRLEGASRPGHFDGVALVVAKLLVAARPDRAYFGQKDAQQCAVVRRLAADLDTGVEIVVCPTVRDRDGLALASRNAYLSEAERAQARAIPAGLAAAARCFESGERHAAVLKAAVRGVLEDAGAAIDYIAVVDPEYFKEVETPGPGCQILVAARIGNTRLIDVLQLGVDVAPVLFGASGKACSG